MSYIYVYEVNSRWKKLAPKINFLLIMIIEFIGNACDENDCQDDYDEIDDVIARGGPRFACRYCSVVSLSVLASQIAWEGHVVLPTMRTVESWGGN